MHQLGLDDFVAGSIDEFVYIGRYWSQHIEALGELRVGMRQRFAGSMLGQSDEFATAFEAMLRTMWLAWCDGAAVQDIVVNDAKHAIVNCMARVESPLTETPSVVVVSASKLTELAFWSQSALGQSLNRLGQQGEKISIDIAFENTRGLPEIFNAAIRRAPDDSIVVFIHDDVWIDEYNFSDAVTQGLQHFDVVGVAGNKRRLHSQPAWCFIDQQFTWDDRRQLSGRVGHGSNAYGQLSEFGEVPAACELLDGVFLAARKNTLTNNKVQFDPLFDFHFYDLDFCRTARNAHLSLGTWPIHFTHQSGGSFGTPAWRESCKKYFAKWDESPLAAESASLPVLNNDRDVAIVTSALMKMALDNENSEQWLPASHLYLEVLKLNAVHSEANHRLGLLEVKLIGAAAALPRFEVAVQQNPELEDYWVSYINTLFQSGAVDTAISAIEWGQKYGLQPNTAQAMTERFVTALERVVDDRSDQSINNVIDEADDAMAPPPWPTPKPSLTANLDYIVQPKSNGRRYVIFAPLYRHNSAGIRVLFDLQKWLILAGYDAIVAASTREYPIDEFSEDIVIYPEVVTGNPLKAKRVVRYILNIPGKLAGTRHYAKNELLIAYNADLMTFSNGKILQVPSIEPFFYCDDTVKNIDAVYIGRGKDLHLHPQNCVYITKNFPATRKEVAQFLRSVKMLYTYDSFTVIIHEAILCGCQVKLIGSDGDSAILTNPLYTPIDEFKAQLHDFIEMTKLL